MSLTYEDSSWDFRKTYTKSLTHGFHAYPAQMIPQIARRLLDTYGVSSSLLFDPYCGSGTSLVEANLQGINAIGTDLNPLARLISTTKTTLIGRTELERQLRDFHTYSEVCQKSSTLVQVPEFDNINFWFSEKAKIKLALIKTYINTRIRITKLKNFFLTAFSETVRESSFTKQGEFKLVRIPLNKRLAFAPDSFDIMKKKLKKNMEGLIEFQQKKLNGSSSNVYRFNTVQAIPRRIIKNRSVDIVITSPPYGDSRTTVAYGQYSRLANQWMGQEGASGLDKQLMGGIPYANSFTFESKFLLRTLSKIGKQDPQRRRDVEAFFVDYKKSIDNVAETVKRKGIVCYVVGNRTVKNINIPTDVITKELFEGNGFRHLETIVRAIPNKRMPSRNSPSNVPGKTSSTMKHEFIVVCEKKQ